MPGPIWAQLNQSLCGCGLEVSEFAKLWGRQGEWVLCGTSWAGAWGACGVLRLLCVVTSCHIRGTKVLSGEGLRSGGVSLSMCLMALHTLKCLHLPLR